MNQLKTEFGDQLEILAFPCNQFGHQENNNSQELLNILRYVRPGNNFEPLCMLFEKIEVNGKNEHELYTFLKTALPLPEDDQLSLMFDPKGIIWSPVRRSDVAWNFEKFLVDASGKPVKRFSKKFETIQIRGAIQETLGVQSERM